MSALVLVGCGSTTASHRGGTQVTVPQLVKARAHVVQPVAGELSEGVRAVSASQPQVAPAPGHDPVPTSPATATSAPAKGAPTDAQVRAEIARFKLAIRRYHLDRLKFAGLLLDPARLHAGVWNVSIASVETAYGHAVACGGVLRVPELGVANKTLPCGTEITFRYGNRAIRVPVIDRGPYIPGREWDLSGATAEALHFPGLGPIRWRLG